ncbi:MAG: hypothetical protein GXO22_05215 [Aquificae bacterium]|nr:hypothetical protein [Aquificota bacterium]
MNHIDLSIKNLIKTPVCPSIKSSNINGIKFQQNLSESTHSLEIITTNPFSDERKSYYKIIQDFIDEYQKDSENIFQEALYTECISEITGALAPYFVIIKNLGLNISLKGSEKKLDKNTVRIINTALTLGYIDIKSTDIDINYLTKLAQEIKNEPVNIYFYNYWDLAEYNIFFNKEDEEIEYYDVKHRESTIDKLWIDLDRLYTYFWNAGSRYYRYKPVLYLDTPITRKLKDIWLSFKKEYQKNPITDDFGDISIELDFKNLKVKIKILDENIRKFILFDLSSKRVKSWDEIREIFFEAEDNIFKYLLHHPFNKRFVKIESLNETIKEKAVFCRIESNEFGTAFENPKEDFNLLKVHTDADYFDFIKIYQYGDLNLYFVQGNSSKRSVNFGAFFVDINPKEIEILKFLEEQYLSLLTTNSIKNYESFYTQKLNHLLPTLSPSHIALQLVKELPRIRKAK